jgi:hypothetical protein
MLLSVFFRNLSSLGALFHDLISHFATLARFFFLWEQFYGYVENSTGPRLRICLQSLTSLSRMCQTYLENRNTPEARMYFGVAVAHAVVTVWEVFRDLKPVAPTPTSALTVATVDKPTQPTASSAVATVTAVTTSTPAVANGSAAGTTETPASTTNIATQVRTVTGDVVATASAVIAPVTNASASTASATTTAAPSQNRATRRSSASPTVTDVTGHENAADATLDALEMQQNQDNAEPLSDLKCKVREDAASSTSSASTSASAPVALPVVAPTTASSSVAATSGVRPTTYIMGNGVPVQVVSQKKKTNKRRG